MVKRFCTESRQVRVRAARRRVLGLSPIRLLQNNIHLMDGRHQNFANNYHPQLNLQSYNDKHLLNSGMDVARSEMKMNYNCCRDPFLTFWLVGGDQDIRGLSWREQHCLGNKLLHVNPVSCDDCHCMVGYGEEVVVVERAIYKAKQVSFPRDEFHFHRLTCSQIKTAVRITTFQ